MSKSVLCWHVTTVASVLWKPFWGKKCHTRLSDPVRLQDYNIVMSYQYRVSLRMVMLVMLCIIRESWA